MMKKRSTISTLNRATLVLNDQTLRAGVCEPCPLITCTPVIRDPCPPNILTVELS